MVLGDSSSNQANNVSEHELRFRKSIEKLHVPDWSVLFDLWFGS